MQIYIGQFIKNPYYTIAFSITISKELSYNQLKLFIKTADIYTTFQMNKVYNFLTVIVLGVLLNTTALAQQDMQFSHYMFNGLFYSPAYAGLDPLPKGSFIHRSQWAGYKGIDGAGAPSTQIFNFGTPLTYFNEKLENHGAGLSVVLDRVGAIRNLNFNLSYAHQFNMDSWSDHSLISVGAKIGFWSQSLDTDILRYGDLDDQTLDDLVANGASQLKPDMSLGVLYKDTKKGHFVGISFNHAIRPNFDFNTQAASKISRHMYLQGGYSIPISGDSLIVKPTTLLMTDFRRLSYNIGATIKKVDNDFDYWGGLSFRQSFASKEATIGGSKLNNDDISIIVGGSFLKDKNLGHKSLSISYAIDLVTTGKNAKQSTSHEIMLSYLIPLEKITHNTPRYLKNEIETRLPYRAIQGADL